ncbi:ATP-binding protein [Streptomyces sp. MAR4 CNX-425]|uniref:ATP-binding protein n=1 Tax=Streptomyces sp. MAR4 CNX-425 TaxID=3406343 RepID=UPI003B50AC7E
MTTQQTTSVLQQPVKWSWTRHRRCVGLARAQLRKMLARWGMAELEFAAVAVLSELVANAVVHARVPPGREVHTRFVPVDGGVRIEVHDASGELPVPRVPDESGGYGLTLVDELSARWGVAERGGVGKCVWAVITDGDRPAPQAAG